MYAVDMSSSERSQFEYIDLRTRNVLYSKLCLKCCLGFSQKGEHVSTLQAQ